MKNIEKEANLKIKKEIINTIGDIKMEISDVEKMQANKDVEGLIEALKDKDSYFRREVAYGGSTCRANWRRGGKYYEDDYHRHHGV